MSKWLKEFTKELSLKRSELESFTSSDVSILPLPIQ